MYRIIQFETRWIVCVGPAMLLAFDRMDSAVATVNDAEKLMEAVHTSEPLPGFALYTAEEDRRGLDAQHQLQTTSAFVERRRANRSGQSAEVDATTSAQKAQPVLDKISERPRASAVDRLSAFCTT